MVKVAHLMVPKGYFTIPGKSEKSVVETSNLKVKLEEIKDSLIIMNCL